MLTFDADALEPRQMDMPANVRRAYILLAVSLFVIVTAITAQRPGVWFAYLGAISLALLSAALMLLAWRRRNWARNALLAVVVSWMGIEFISTVEWVWAFLWSYLEGTHVWLRLSSSLTALLIPIMLVTAALICQFASLVPLNGVQANDWFGGRAIPRWVLAVLFFLSMAIGEVVMIGLIVILNLD